MVRAVMCLYEESRTTVKDGLRFFERILCKDCCTSGLGVRLSLLLFAIVMDVVTQDACEGLMEYVLYADDLVLMSDTINGLKAKLQRWKDALESREKRAERESRKDKNYGEWIKGLNVSQQNRSMWNLCEKSDG